MDAGFTMAAWVKFSNSPGGGGNDACAVEIPTVGAVNGGRLRFNGGISTLAYNSTFYNVYGSMPAYDTWVHYTATILNGTHTFYTNGVLTGTASYPTNGTMGTDTVYAGRSSYFGMDGSIDDLRIYNTALTAAQVQAIYRANGMPSRVVAQNLGLVWSYYNGYFADNVNFFAGVTPVATGSVTSIPSINAGTGGYVPGDNSREFYSVQWIGYFQSDYTGVWTFYTASDDASYLWLGDVALSGFTTANALVQNGGLHAVVERSGTISLVAGQFYPIRIQFGENQYGDNMIVSFSNPVLAKTTNGFGYLSPIIKFSKST